MRPLTAFAALSVPVPVPGSGTVTEGVGAAGACGALLGTETAGAEALTSGVPACAGGAGAAGVTVAAGGAAAALWVLLASAVAPDVAWSTGAVGAPTGLLGLCEGAEGDAAAEAAPLPRPLLELRGDDAGAVTATWDTTAGRAALRCAAADEPPSEPDSPETTRR